MENTEDKKTEEKANRGLDTMNYNERPDGYGFGPAESEDTEQEYEKDPHFTKHCIDLGSGYRCHKNEPYNLNIFGQRNQYGPVDQYSFRDIHIIRRGK